MAKAVIAIDTKEAKELLGAMSGRAFTARLRSAAAQSVRNGLLEHFRSRQSEGNKKGWPDKGFWDSNRGDSVTKNMRRPRVDGESTVIEIDSPALAHKMTGGVVKPKGHRYLAVPATPEAYMADSVRSFLGGRLAFVYGLYEDGSWRPALAAQDNYLKRMSRGKNAGKERLARRNETGNRGVGTVQFWLVRSVSHQPDDRALPPIDDLSERARSSACAELSTILEETRANPARQQEV